MRSSGSRWLQLLVLPLVLLAAAALWQAHARAWDPGRRSPILNDDTAPIALAGRELAWNGRLATPFALPIELVRHPSPPWPLTSVRPGLVLIEAAIFRLVPARGFMAGSDARAWLTLIVPFCCFLLLAASLAMVVRHLFARWWPQAPALARAGAALTLGLAFALDPEAQHFAMGGFAELPYTLALLLAFFGLALEAPAANPIAFGALLGVGMLFHSGVPGLALLFALGAAACAPPAQRVRTALLVLAGVALPLLPWWFERWRALGSPFAGPGSPAIWDGVEGRTGFTLAHRAAAPELPRGLHAVRLLAAKAAHHLPALAGDLLAGPRGLWLGALAGWLVLARPPRALAVTALVALGAVLLALVNAALTQPTLRALFPVRVLLEPAGILALWALVQRIPEASLPAPARRALLVATAALALAWGGWSTARGLTQARVASRDRVVPASSTLTSLSIVLSGNLAPGEPLMSNLGSALAWQTNHPVVHLAATPDDVDACRRRLDFRHVVLVFRSGRRAWPGWSEIVEREGFARTLPGLHVTAERRYHSDDGFDVVWLVLGPLGPALASNVR